TFLEYVQQLRDAGTREGEARSVARGAVQLLTVHAAKGLEFPVVVLGDVTRETPGARGLLLDPQLGIVPPISGERDGQTAKSAVCALAQARAADQEAAESDRLLYVAATRAQELLLLSGVAARGKTNWLARLPLTLPEPACDPAKPEPVILDVGGAPVACYSYAEDCDLPLLKATPLVTPSATLPDTLPLLAPLRTESQRADGATEAALQDPPPRTWRVVPVRKTASAPPPAPAWVVGQVVHRALERWRFPEELHAGSFTHWAEAEARSCGIMDEAELANAIRRAARMLIRFQATPLYERMSGALRRLHEAPYSLLTASGLEQGIIDALFETSAGWTLVEFKTDAFRSNVYLEQSLAATDYITQVGRYVQAAEQLLGVRPQSVLCLLNVAGAVQIIEGIEDW
ncbi:MAG: hypothetical protein JW892_10275, partial [Anaerolineae bacterium]|nr:hypothetical protein [Anaerolineae bacterium]